ncbi:coiled-coil domain-containing protein 136 isoform X2 [Jatropha curcas]|uniref:coiled-coil domain-containing protein 136 isoform X2 n=1 Tax=Jatropha curcas TaxID=180498 RepID=UPI0005FAA302|nr:coiled-coil domain-containing protein 136 isoform X2 [Jatropha curcas]
MAGEDQEEEKSNQEEEEEEDNTNPEVEHHQTISSYIGLSFCLFLASLPTNSISLVQKLHSQIRDLSLRLFQAEEQLKQMKSRRKEDSKANARVVEIFASHRNAWQAEEKRLLHQIDAASEEMASLRARIQDLEGEREEWNGRIQDLEKEVGEREEMIGFMSRSAAADFAVEEEEEVSGICGKREYYGGEEENVNFVYSPQQQQQPINGGFSSDFMASASKFWSERTNLWQDMQYESLESLYHMKHFVARESPWKVDGESTGISSKLKLLEQELLNLEEVGKTDLSKVPSLMRKQAKRCQALAGKIDDLCRRMQASDPCEPTLTPEFRTQRQTEFLLEAFRLQQRASETGQKLMALQTEIGKSYYADDRGSQANLTMRRSFDSIRNNLKEVQRNLEIWLARIIGDLEGILARDGASRSRDYYVSRYPFVQ